MASKFLSLGFLALAVATSIGCNSLENTRGTGFSESENWGQQLREQRADNAASGGWTTKAQQIERNLGVK